MSFGVYEEKCRKIFQELFKKEFKSVRPDWLKNPWTYQNLELDGYNPDIVTPSKFRRVFERYDRENKEEHVKFVGRDGSEYEVFDKSKFMYSLYFPDEMKKALGLPVDFPLELTLNPHPSLPIPAVDFGESRPLKSLDLREKLKRLNIYATPADSFSIPVRDIFTNTTIKHTSSKESHEWLNGPNMRYWPQQLNFAVWCATTGCGVSLRSLLEEKMGGMDVTDHELKLPPQIRAILWFHVYFTIRRILFQMGGIQSSIALPGDPPFNEKDNRYDIPSYKRICKEFNISTDSDFRCHKGENHGLGSVYIWVSYVGPSKAGHKSSYPGFFKFSEEGGEGSKGNLLQYILNDIDNGYEYFLTRVSNGLTNAGQARLNQSIEALVYCVLGSQVNVRSSVLGNTGSAQEVRQEFLVLLEDAIKQPDISKSVQRFQLAVQEAKVKLDLAVSPGTWLMPSRMVINTESTIGYNNRLKRVEPSMKLGVNTDVNSKSVPVGIKHNLGKSKVLLPHTLVVKKRVERPKIEEKESETPPAKPDATKHEINLAVITIVVGGLAWYMFR